MTSATRIDWSKALGSRLPRNLGQEVDSYFASLGRDGIEEIRDTSRRGLGFPCRQEITSTMPPPVSVLHEKVQLVVTNRQWNESLGQEAESAGEVTRQVVRLHSP